MANINDIIKDVIKKEETVITQVKKVEKEVTETVIGQIIEEIKEVKNYERSHRSYSAANSSRIGFFSLLRCLFLTLGCLFILFGFFCFNHCIIINIYLFVAFAK